MAKTLFGKTHGAALADDRDADLAGLGKVFFNLARDIPAQQVGGIVIHIVGIDHNAEFASGLNGVGLGNAVEGRSDVFQIFQALDVVFQ